MCTSSTECIRTCRWIVSMLGTAWKPTWMPHWTAHVVRSTCVSFDAVEADTGTAAGRGTWHISCLMSCTTASLCARIRASTSPAYGLASRSDRLAKCDDGTTLPCALVPETSLPPVKASLGGSTDGERGSAVPPSSWNGIRAAHRARHVSAKMAHARATRDMRRALSVRTQNEKMKTGCA